MSRSMVKFFGHSFHLIILLYGTIQFFSEVFRCYIPTGIVSAVCITGLVYYFKVPRSTPKEVEAILGKDLTDVDSKDTGCNVTIVAHRGAGLDAPENTLASFKHCKKMGCDFIEFDVCLTADGVPVVFHDSSTGRMCHEDLEIKNTNWHDLKKLNLSTKSPLKERFPRTSIPTLEETVTQLLAENQKMFIDIKDRDTKLIKVILDIYEKHPELYTKAIITSFFGSMIYQIRRKNPRIVGAVAWCPYVIYFASKVPTQGGSVWAKSILHVLDVIVEWLLPRFTYFFAGCSVILLHRYSIDVRSIWEWRKRGLRVIAWTVNKPTEKRYCREVLKIPYLTDTLEENPSNNLTEFNKEMNYFDC